MIFAVICAMVGAMFGWWGVLGVFIIGCLFVVLRVMCSDVKIEYYTSRRRD